MNYETLKTLVLAVEENNKINSGKWSDWSDAAHIADAYEENIDADIALILNRAIKTNGVSLSSDLKTAEKEEWGQNFANNWITRIESRYAAAAIGRLGGSAKTKAKAKAARENGKLGGRPTKKK